MQRSKSNSECFLPKTKQVGSAGSSSNAVLNVPTAPSDHNIAELSTFPGSQRNAIQEVLTDATETVLKVTEAIDEINTLRDNVHLKINEAFETLQQALQLRKTTLLSELESVVLSKTTALTLQKEKFEKTVAAFHILLSHADDELAALGGLMHTELPRELESFSSTHSDIHVDVQTDDLLRELVTFGCISDASLSSSASTWKSTSEAKVMNRFHVKIESKTSKGTAYPHGGLQLKAEMRSNAGVIVHGEVEDHRDGTYTATLIPLTAGPHQLLITLNGQHVNNSPHNLNVLPAHPNHNCSTLGKVQQVVKGPSYPTGVAKSYRGLYIATSQGIYLMDENGNPEKQVKSRTLDNGLLFEGDRKRSYETDGSSVIIKDETVYFAKLSNIYILTLQGDLIKKVWVSGGAAGLAIDEYHRVFASDCSGNRICVLSHNGDSLYTIDGNVTGEHSFLSPYGLAFDLQGNIHVAASGSKTIKVLTKEGVYIRKYGDLKGPRGIAIDAEGYSFVSDYDDNCISIFHSQGNKIHTIEGAPLHHPFGLALANDSLFVANYGGSAVVKYSICKRGLYCYY